MNVCVHVRRAPPPSYRYTGSSEWMLADFKSPTFVPVRE